ncbi:MAG: hypothetical protein K9J16_17360 [Melioribacteraceae bacterium]|nr:hypothetical protein [Melioribacteraceae bacterium]MCF8356580.1 hypothetical protein [Melioribacteraceae bacterium]MCF8395981.1 hypothetical protein [Melioribacteraceae bacterium]MCF8421032.1 hypothetical protein [Melioribacteraceae bacterium]
MKKTLLGILLFPVLLFAQNNLERQFAYAENLFESGLYYQSITEYKRLLFFDDQNEYSYSVNLKIGLAYKNGAKYDEAVEYFSKALINAEDSDQTFECKTEIIRTNILRKTFNRAHELLDELELNSDYLKIKNDIYYWRGWAYMLDDDWESASNEFAKISQDHEIKKLCDEVINDKYSVTFAKVISYILPGSGQIYTGNYLSGLMSLSWNALWGYVTINSFIQDRIFDGIVVGDLLWLRFYRGNVENAGKFAEMKNIDIANKALRYLQENYKGIKP